jgi:hypothetical protein
LKFDALVEFQNLLDIDGNSGGIPGRNDEKSDLKTYSGIITNKDGLDKLGARIY